MELAFYWSLMFSQFIDVKRKVSCQPSAVTTVAVMGSLVREGVAGLSLAFSLMTDGFKVVGAVGQTARPRISTIFPSLLSCPFVSKLGELELGVQGPGQKKA